MGPRTDKAPFIKITANLELDLGLNDNFIATSVFIIKSLISLFKVFKSLLFQEAIL